MNWTKIIKDAEKNKGFSEKNCARAHNWSFCAVGSHKSILNRPNLFQGDLNPLAKKLGKDFDYYVENDDYIRAQYTLNKINDMETMLK